jgi:hypothetical protein
MKLAGLAFTALSTGAWRNFSDALIDRVYESGPYKSRASARTTRNSNDGVTNLSGIALCFNGAGTQ